jgi:PAS domain S-box-containing protein
VALGFLTGYQAWIPLGVALVAWHLTAPEKNVLNRRAGVVLDTLLNVVAALALRQAACNAQLPAGFRKGLRWVAIGLAMVALGGVYVLLGSLVEPDSRAAFSPADFLFIATYAAILSGLLFMPRAERPSIGWGRLLADSGVFVAGVGMPLWFFFVIRGLASPSGALGTLFVIAYPMVTFAGITLLNVVLLTRMALPSRRAFNLLIAAIAVSWIADLVYLLDSVQRFTERTNINWTEVFNALALCLYLLAAGRIRADRPEEPRAAQPAASSPLPVATLVIVVGWLLIFVSSGNPVPVEIRRALLILALLFVTLAVRELFIYRDGARWLAAEVERESRARFEALVRHSSDVIMVVDALGAVRFASPAILAALGVPPEGVAGRPLLEFAHPEDQAKGAAFLDGILKAPKAPQAMQWRLRHVDGAYRHFETTGSSAMGVPAVAGMVLNLRDVTDRVTLEERLRQAEKLEAIGQLVGGIAHNFNNILTSTTMRLGLLLQNRSLPEAVIKEIQALEKEAKRTAELTGKLVLFGQQQFLRREPVNLRQAVADLEPEIKEILGRDIQLYLAGGSTPEWVDADPALMEQVIRSICSNARDAMPRGGCLIIEVIEVDPTSVSPAPQGETRPESIVRMSFQDTGQGMDSAVRQRLFEPFFTTKGVGGGLGLGLAAVHGIVKQHGGWMDVDSAPNQGSTFRVYLPRIGAPA